MWMRRRRRSQPQAVGAASMWSKLRRCWCCSKGERPREAKKFKPKATPLPWTKLLVICAVLFVNNFGINMIFPFLPFLIHDFFPYLDSTELGTKAGYLGSAYFVGSFTGSLLWGWISDKIGRRPVLLMGMLGTLATELLFGFSQNFAWAIAARFLWGLLNGNLGVAKTYISEVCDDSNQAKGFSTVGTTGGLGRLSGSVIGGYLAQPASKFGPLKTSFFCKYPYSLPCIVGGALAVISFIAAFLFLEESLHSKKKQRRSSGQLEEEESSVDTSLSGERNDSSGSMQSNDSGIELLTNERLDSETELYDLSNDDEISSTTDPGLLIAESDIDTDSDMERVNSDTELLISVQERERKSSNANQGCSAECWPKFRQYCIPECIFTQCSPGQCFNSARNSVMDSYESCVACVMCLKGSCTCCCRRKWSPSEAKSDGRGKLRKFGRSVFGVLWLMVDRRVFLSTLMYGLTSFVIIISNELVPLLLVTDHDSGGYNMDDSEIGIALMSVAVFQLLWQLLVYPRIAACLGYRRTLMLGLFLFSIMSVLFPLSNQITGPIDDDDNDLMAMTGSGLNSNETNNASLSTFDFCGHNLSGNGSQNLVNENSVVRIPAKVWVWLMFNLTFWIISRVMVFTSVMVLISNSSLTETRGTVNGFGQALCAIGRSMGPVIGAPLFAWSENTGKGWPLNYHFVFDLLGVGGVVLVGVVFLLPKSIELKRVRKEKKESRTSEQTLAFVEEEDSNDDHRLRDRT